MLAAKRFDNDPGRILVAFFGAKASLPVAARSRTKAITKLDEDLAAIGRTTEAADRSYDTPGFIASCRPRSGYVPHMIRIQGFASTADL